MALFKIKNQEEILLDQEDVPIGYVGNTTYFFILKKTIGIQVLSFPLDFQKFGRVWSDVLLTL